MQISVSPYETVAAMESIVRKTKDNINIYKLTCSMPRLNDIE